MGSAPKPKPAPVKRAPRKAAFELFPEMEPLPPKFRPDPDQEAAVLAGPGPVMVVAGPGGGKTGVLVRRTQRLLENGAAPERVLVLTFTRKAAQELRERLAAKKLKPRVETFHSWGCLLKEWGHNRDVLPEEERLELIRPLARAAGLRQAKAADLIARAKLGRDPGGALPAPLLLEAYGELLKDEKVFDYEGPDRPAFVPARKYQDLATNWPGGSTTSWWTSSRT